MEYITRPLPGIFNGQGNGNEHIDFLAQPGYQINSFSQRVRRTRNCHIYVGICAAHDA